MNACRPLPLTSARHAPLLCGLIAALLALSWQMFVVHDFHQGNWTALFLAGAQFPPPGELAFERIPLAADTGSDGQFYHYIAHDPFLRRGFTASLDSAAYRYGKILVPAMAWAFAFGQDRFIDAAYTGVVLLFTALGAYWSSLFARDHGYPAITGLAFLLVPATIVSLETLTVDVAVLAFTAAFVVALERGARTTLFAVLALAPLARETGAVLLASFAIVAALHRKWRDVAVAMLLALPWLGWLAFVRWKTGPNLYELRLLPFAGTIDGVIAAFRELGAGQTFLAALDLWLIGGVLLAVAMALWSLGRKPGAVEVACALFAVIAVFQQRADLWINYHALGRVFSPFALLLAMKGLARRDRALLVPLLLIMPRFLFTPAARLLYALS